MQLQLDWIAPRHTLIDRDVIETARMRGIPVMAWTVDDPVRILELLDLGVDSIISNEPTRLRKLVNAYFSIPADARSLLRFRPFWEQLRELPEFQKLGDLVEQEQNASDLVP